MPSDAALENLVRISQLDKVPFSADLMARMLAMNPESRLMFISTKDPRPPKSGCTMGRSQEVRVSPPRSWANCSALCAMNRPC